jgi:predicted ATPase
VLLALKGEHDRVPLASQGDGLFRLMELSLGLVRASGGTLVIDEIDTGLHYSVMSDLWRLVVEAARRFDLQVFATTHSYDCIRGLAWLCENYPHLGEDVSIQKIEPVLDEAVALDAEKIQIAFRQHIEMR